MKVQMTRTKTVLIATAALVVVAGGSATASSLITNKQLATGAVNSRVIKNGSVKQHDLAPSVVAKLNRTGTTGPQGSTGPQGPAGTAKYVGPNWSIIDRNVIGNGDSYLRSGPDTPPSGIGSLGLRTGSGSDKADFGNQVDFVGSPLSSLGSVSYSVYVTGEDLSISPGNIPNVQFEVNPHTARSYSTLVYVPPAGSATANAWTKLDATGAQWYYTGGFGTDSGCNQTTYCTLQQAEAAAPNGTLISAQISKGRDYAFSGAVDDLTFGSKKYDFEPLGVVVSAN